jgi:beta-lactam-binding protein with PASTA domain
MSDSIESGLVMESQPLPGENVAPGSSVTLLVSTDYPPILLPDVAGLVEDDARQALEQGACDSPPCVRVATEEAHDGEVAEGSVIECRPPAGSQVERGSSVTLVISLGPEQVIVPNLEDRTISQATAELGDVGLLVGDTQQEYSEKTPGLIIRSDPVAGTEVDKGSAVDFVISQGCQDTDNDGFCDDDDAFPTDQAEWSDRDNDGIGDNADKCPDDSDPNQLDTDQDGQGDACDDDDDNDGVTDSNDRFPLDATESSDSDDDGIGDNADPDDDNDGMPDDWEEDHGLNSKVNDAAADRDSDYLSNLKEYQEHWDPSNPNDPIPVHSVTFRRYRDLRGDTQHNTQISVDQYDCGIVGYAALDGDINENGSNDPVRAIMVKRNGTWWIDVDFHTHDDHEDWQIDTICLDKSSISDFYELREYRRPEGNFRPIQTSFRIDDYVCGIVGMDARDGDINEQYVDIMFLMEAEEDRSRGTWQLRAEIATHDEDGESWRVSVLCVQKRVQELFLYTRFNDIIGTPLDNNSGYETNISAQEYTCGIIGASARYGDINENGPGDILFVYLEEVQGSWRIFVDFRSHHTNEMWDVNVLCFRSPPA